MSTRRSDLDSDRNAALLIELAEAVPYSLEFKDGGVIATGGAEATLAPYDPNPDLDPSLPAHLTAWP